MRRFNCLLSVVVLSLALPVFANAAPWDKYKRKHIELSEEDEAQVAKNECQAQALTATLHLRGIGRALKAKRIMKECMAAKGFEKS